MGEKAANASSALVCPVEENSSIFGELPQKFPLDMIIPSDEESEYFGAYEEGCFQINTGNQFRQTCVPGMLIGAIKPFIIIGVGLKFIFSS